MERGKGCDFGIRGFNRLAPTKGKAFKKEKTKLKLKNFTGGGAPINRDKVNSISLI